MSSVAVAVAPLSLSGFCRSSGQITAGRALGISCSAINKHYNTNAIVAVETNSSTIGAANLTATSSSESYQNYDRLLPCSSHKSTPRVEHLVVSEEGTVLAFICKSLHLPPLYVADLIQFGAVHYALVCPPPPPNATEQQIRIFKEVTEPSVLRKRASIKGKTVQRAQKTFRITSVDQFVEPGMYLRVHVHPKRFPRCYEIDWRSRIIAVTELYVVLDKPAGTSVCNQSHSLTSKELFISA